MLTRLGPLTDRRWLAILTVLCLSTAGLIAAEAPDPAIEAAAKSFNFGRRDEAFAILDRAIATNSKNAQLYFARGRLLADTRQPARAVTDFGEVIRLDPRAAAAYQFRGQERLKLGRLDEAVSDFNALVKLAPGIEPQLWQRGIALYLAGQFAEARRQFESHRRVNTNDVETAAWHFLCAARLEGTDKARAELFSVEHDPRVPMQAIHRLFAGQAGPAEVMAAAKSGEPEPEQLVRQLFYAHLYLGLYYEVTGEPAKARDHLQLAAGKYQVPDFMGDVARVAWERLEKPVLPVRAPR